MELIRETRQIPDHATLAGVRGLGGLGLGLDPDFTVAKVAAALGRVPTFHERRLLGLPTFDSPDTILDLIRETRRVPDQVVLAGVSGWSSLGLSPGSTLTEVAAALGRAPTFLESGRLGVWD